MKTNKKTSGFFIVEILIVLVIIGILVVALLPNLTNYIQRAKFVDVVNSVGAMKTAVSACYYADNGNLSNCSTGVSGGNIVAQGAAGSYLASVSATNGVITGTSQSVFGPNNTDTYTYILTPAASNGTLTWSDGGTCKAAGLC